MQLRIRHRVLTVVATVATLAAVAPAALASTSPSLSLDQSAGKAAGSTANLGLDLKFTNTGTDSPDHLTINLPPGLLADASRNGGSCIKTAQVTGSACEVGSGTVTAEADPIPPLLNLPVPVSVPVTFYLIPSPAPGDLAGLAVEGLGEQLGSTGEIKVRPTGDPNGVGVTINLALPDQLPLTLPIIGPVNLAQISVTEINSTFDGLRYPATCPATPANLSVLVDSYSDSTVDTVTAPLAVTGCSSLPFAPAFKATAARDGGDRQVTLGTTITQAATEAPSKSVTLAFPAATLAPNLASIQALCANLASGTCPTVGSVSATSPLYPATLTGKAYLTGSLSGLSLTLVFPPPFPLTLTGAVDLVKNSATFTGLPDIPLTNLGVTLSGGAKGLFLSTCQVPANTATATLTDQNGDKTVKALSTFMVSGCPAGGSGSGSGGSGSGGSGSGVSGAGASGAGGSGGSTGSSNVVGSGNGSTSQGVTVGTTKLSNGRVSGLSSGHASLSFRLAAAKHAARLGALTIELPAGMSFVGHRVGHKLKVTGVSVTGAKIKSLTLSHGHLVITLRKAVSSLVVKLSASALRESAALRRKAGAHQLKTLHLTVISTNTRGRHATIHVRFTALGR
jgi:hypothetical protein